MKYNQLHNLQHYEGICTECQSNELLIDSLHGYVFCANCGLIIQNISSPKKNNIKGEKHGI